MYYIYQLSIFYYYFAMFYFYGFLESFWTRK